MASTTSQVGDLFDDWARKGRAEGMERRHGPVARQALERLGVRAGARYLDIGCGNGYSVRWAAAVAPEVEAVGLDVSPEMIEQARLASKAFPNARFHNAPFPLAQLADASFQMIFSMEVFYYLPDLDAGLDEVRRLLTPGGRFVCVVDYYAENPESHAWPEELGLTLQLRSEAEWADAFERAGLRVVEQARLVPAGKTEGTAPSLMTLGGPPARK